MKIDSSKPVLIFGYGSLMSRESLHADAPDARDIRPANIKGYRREFSKLDPAGLGSCGSAEIKGIPYCAVDVISTEDEQQVNGIVFEARGADLDALTRREDGYTLVSTPAYDFRTGQPLGQCFVFSSGARDGGDYEYDNPAQERYLEICLEGAKEHGDKFYRQFLATTYAGDKTLDELLGGHYLERVERWSREMAGRVSRRLTARLTQI